jgi:glycosyltransferase involved in cell wall biosynthesis
VHFIPNGINPYNRNVDYTAECKAFLPPGASLEKPFVFYSGRRHISTKGCHTLLEALTLVGYEGQVFFAGEMNPSKYIDQLKEYQSKLNLFFIDFIHPLPVLLSFVEKCDLFIFPSEKEAMSIMLLEVASVGRPIIASDIPPNKHVFNDDEVLFFRSKDVEDLAEKIRFALDNEAAMAALGRKALKKVNEQYLWQMVSKKYEILYESMLKGDEVYA